jgi:hypothetical protein
MDGTARCICCFRVERRRDAAVVEVTQPGGARRPPIPGDLAVWRTLRRVKAGELASPVAMCSACGQPMFLVEGELPPVPRWEIPLPDGVVAVGPDGRVLDADDAEADARIEAHHRPAVEDAPTAGQLGFAFLLVAAVVGIGAVVGACECPTVALAVAAGGAGAAGRSRRS